MTDFSELLGNVPADKFRQSMNKLLNECFIIKQSSDTLSDYRFIMANAELFEGILGLLGYELVIRDDQGVITIYNPTGTGRIRFSKLESILALILRLLYIEKMKELSQVHEVIVLLEEVYEKYNMLKIGKLGRVNLVNALRSFKRVNLIQNLDRMDSGLPEIRIQIYPSIMFAITSASLDEVYKVAQEKLSEFAKGEETDDSDDESDNEDIN